MSFGVVIVAAGRSTRFGDKAYKKPFAPLAGRAVWLHSAERFMNRSEVSQVVVVVSTEDREEFDRKFGANVAILGITVTNGGAERADSVKAGLEKLSDDCEFVAIHDAARPCLTDKLVDQIFAAAKKTGAVIPATPVAATLKRVANGQIAETVPRDNLWMAQTPQVFRRDWLTAAYASHSGPAVTDDAQLIEQAGHPVTIVEGSPLNLKITERSDLKLAEQILKVLPKPNPNAGKNPFADDDMWR